MAIEFGQLRYWAINFQIELIGSRPAKCSTTAISTVESNAGKPLAACASGFRGKTAAYATYDPQPNKFQGWDEILDIGQTNTATSNTQIALNLPRVLEESQILR